MKKVVTYGREREMKSEEHSVMYTSRGFRIRSIDYVKQSNRIDVYLEGKRVGSIKLLGIGYTYTPEGTRAHGAILPSIEAVKKNLETKQCFIEPVLKEDQDV